MKSPWRSALVVLVCALPALGASYRTSNFAVEAPTAQVAEQIAQAAEKYRQVLARQWLGRELPDWLEPCVLNVNASTGERRGGSSTFYFDRGRVFGQRVNIRGPIQELLPRVLPHELTHSIFAHHFGGPIPRWADEGGAILSEDAAERERRDVQMEHMLLRSNLTYSLEELFDLNDYPSDLRVFYTQSYSITQFLVDLRDRETYLAFLAYGMRNDWDRAVRTFYHFPSVADLDRAWRTRLRLTSLCRQFSTALSHAFAAVDALIGDAGEAAPDRPAKMQPPALLPFLAFSRDTIAAIGRLRRSHVPPTSAFPSAAQSSRVPPK